MNLDRLTFLLSGMTRDGCDCYTAAPEFGGGNALEVETGMFLYALTLRLKPRCVVQTGTHYGYSSAWITAALADNYAAYPEKGPGHLYTWDKDDADGRANALLVRLGLRNLATLYIGDTADLSSGTSDLPPIDFLYLDADHTTEAVLAEWQRFSPRLAPNALVGFHDTRLDIREAEAVRVIEEYTGHVALKLRNLRGFDLLQIP